MFNIEDYPKINNINEIQPGDQVGFDLGEGNVTIFTVKRTIDSTLLRYKELRLIAKAPTIPEPSRRGAIVRVGRENEYYVRLSPKSHSALQPYAWRFLGTTKSYAMVGWSDLVSWGDISLVFDGVDG